jgi:hypothetical protein
MSGSWLHADDTLATAMRSLVPDVGILSTRVLVTLQDALLILALTFARRSGGAFMLIGLVLLRHGQNYLLWPVTTIALVAPPLL